MQPVADPEEVQQLATSSAAVSAKMWSEKVEQAVRQCRQDESVSEDDLHQMAEPLEQYLRRQIRNLTLLKLFKLMVLIAAAVAALLYTPLYLHLRAFGRIGLVKVTQFATLLTKPLKAL